MADISTIDPVDLAQRIVSGNTQTQIAQSLGVTQPAISRLSHNPKIKSLIDQMSNDLIQRKLTTARDNLELLIDQLPTRLQAEAITDDHGRYTNTVNYQGQVIPGDVHKQAISQGAKASVKLLESVGILPSQSPSYFFQTLVQQSNTQVVLPGIAALLSNLLGVHPADTEVIDIDPVQALRDMDAE